MNIGLNIRTLLSVVSTCLCLCNSSAGITEDFSADPANTGWVKHGDASLFRWNSTSHKLEVTWDSSRPNSYYSLPLGMVLTETNDFALSFELQLDEFQAGMHPDKPNPFQIAAGLVLFSEATAGGFVRGSGYESPNLVEFSFFPDPGGAWLWGPSITATMTDWTGTNWSAGGFTPGSLTINDTYRVSLNYSAANRTLKTTLYQNGTSFSPIPDAVLGGSFRGFKVDHFAICSYSDTGQDPFYAGSIQAKGRIDNVQLELPLMVSSSVADGAFKIVFPTKAGLNYFVERSTNWVNWVPVAGPITGSGTRAAVADTDPQPQGYYRVREQQ